MGWYGSYLLDCYVYKSTCGAKKRLMSPKVLPQIGISDFWYFPRFWCQANFSYICLPLSLRIGERIRSIFAFLAISDTIFTAAGGIKRANNWIVGRYFMHKLWKDNIQYLFQIQDYQGSSLTPRKSIYFFIRNDFFDSLPPLLLCPKQTNFKWSTWSQIHILIHLHQKWDNAMNRRGSEENFQKKQCKESS